jgi:hypothetical protein
MHEQIRQLAEQAGWDNHHAQFDTRIEKFAQLIVRECMWKIMTRKEEAIDNEWRVDEAMSAALLDISEHFGVEE